MLKDQAAAWKAVSGEQTISIPDGKGRWVDVKVNVNPIAMNYGVNQRALQGIAGLHTDAITGWHVSDALNVPGLKELFGTDSPEQIGISREGVLGKLIAKLEHEHRQQFERADHDLNIAFAEHQGNLRDPGGPGDSAAKLARSNAKFLALEAAPGDQSTPLGAALELTRQIAAIQREGSYRKAGTEPYKMPVRVAVLAELLGVKVAFNCTNGTGRTGELDAEIKHFKLQMALTGKVPPPDRERTPEEQRHFHEVLTNSGNFEMQRLNTGAPVSRAR